MQPRIPSSALALSVEKKKKKIKSKSPKESRTLAMENEERAKGVFGGGFGDNWNRVMAYTLYLAQAFSRISSFYCK